VDTHNICEILYFLFKNRLPKNPPKKTLRAKLLPRPLPRQTPSSPPALVTLASVEPFAPKAGIFLVL